MGSDSYEFEETSNDQEEDDLVSSAFSTTPTEIVEVKSKKSFQPWHLPRKHYCRLKQWSLHTQKLLTKELKLSRASQERPLRYLTIPGDELLDIRQLARVMEKEGVKMQFLGFNTASDSPRSDESDLSFSEVRQLKGIYEKPSEIVQHRIEKITEKNSIARRRVMEHLPFDVINLDFTGSMTGKPPCSEASQFQVVKWLIDQQCNKHRKPWLLFLTVPLARSYADRRTAARLWECLHKNAEQEEFADKLSDLLKITRREVLAEMGSLGSLDEQRYNTGLSLALSKWILGLVDQRPDQWAIELVDTKAYRIQYGDVPNMYSMPFKFIPHDINSVDPTGLTTQTEPTLNPVSELEIGLELIKAISETEDVDKLLDEDRELLEKAIMLSAELLATARYNPDDYIEWVLKTMTERALLKSSEQH